MNAHGDRYVALSNERNAQAFFHVIGAGETSEHLTDADYRLIHRNREQITEWKHPFYGIPCPEGTPTTACGFGGFLGTTWKGIDEQLGLGGDFSPASQRAGALLLVDEKGALQDVLDGQLVLAMNKLMGVWVSFKTLGLQRAQEVFARYGGGAAATTAEDHGLPPVTSFPPMPQATPPLQQPQPQQQQDQPGDQPMPFLLQLLPMVFQLFAPRASAELSKVTGQPANVALPLAQSVFDKAATLLGTGTPQPDGTHAVTTDAQAVATLAALQKAQTENAALVQQVQQHALDYLDKIKPMIDQQIVADAAANAARITLRQSATAAQLADTTKSVKRIVKALVVQSSALLVGGTLVVVAAIAAKGYWPTSPDYLPIVLAPVAMVWQAVVKEMGAVVAHFFDGTPTSNAATLIDRQVEVATARSAAPPSSAPSTTQ